MINTEFFINSVLIGDVGVGPWALGSGHGVIAWFASIIARLHAF